jgi:hypothetical protein
VLLHDGVARSEATLGAVPAIVRGARDRGYCFAALGPSGDPAPPVPRARVTDAVATEPDPGETAALRFTVRLDRPTTRAVSVRVRTVAGTAVADQDYAPVSRRVDFPAGVTSRRVVVRVRGDRVDEAKERLRVVLDRPRGLQIADRAGVGVIRDDDPAPRVRLVDATVEEPLAGVVSGAVRVALDRPSSRRVDVVLVTVPGSADPTDFTPFEVAVSLAPGRTGLEVPVEVLADAVDEPVETFDVQVLSVTRAEVADGTATVTITPPPAAPPPEAPVAP